MTASFSIFHLSSLVFLFVSLRVISWIVLPLTVKQAIHEVTRSTTKMNQKPMTNGKWNSHLPTLTTLLPTAFIQPAEMPDMSSCETAAIGFIKKCDNLCTLVEFRKRLLREGHCERTTSGVTC